MKRKFLILTLCFTIIFSSINFKKSYADGGVISLPILATVSALAVGTGIVISNNDDLYDLGCIFYDYIDKHNDLTWATVQSVFASSVSLQTNKLISVESDFLNIVKDFFDGTFLNSSNSIYVNGIPSDHRELRFDGLDKTFSDNGISIKLKGDPIYGSARVYLPDGTDRGASCGNSSYPCHTIGYRIVDSNRIELIGSDVSNPNSFSVLVAVTVNDGSFGDLVGNSFPYDGNYTWDNVESKKENESIALPVPLDLGQLVGQGSTDFWDNTDNLVGSSDISIPNVENPSISLDNTTSFLNTNVDTNNPSVPDVDSPTIDGILPAFPSFGDSLDFSPMYLTNVTEKFPFSLPWDIGRLIQKFDVDPVAPIFEVPIVSETITLDLTEFSELASIVRFFILFGFILSLIFISTKLMA